MLRNKRICLFTVLAAILIRCDVCFAQAPKIKYATPQVYHINTAIATLSPVSTGGPVGKGNFSAVATVAGSGAAGAVNGFTTAASFNRPEGITVDNSGNIYVADEGNSLIRKISPGGNVSTFAGSGIAGFANGTGTGASFHNPAGVVVDAAGNVFVADANNQRIRKITPVGVVTTIAGNGTVGNADGTGTAATFKLPSGIAIDASGNLYVADSGGNLIRKISLAGVVTTLAGSGLTGNTDGTGAAASFNGPIGIAVDAAGNVYVADSYNNLIRKITPAGVVTTLAGSGAHGDADGTGTAASFKDPIGLTIDTDGNLYTTDAQNNKIRKITPAGVVTTVTGKTDYGTADGSTGTATFNTPFGISIDADGNLYAGDTNNNTIRKIEADKFAIDKPLPAGLIFDTHTGDITGTPTAASPSADYTVTAYNGSGSDAAVVNITVSDAATPPPVAPKISYATPQTYKVNVAITTLSPKNTGGAVPANAYSYVNTIAGGDAAGAADGKGAAAAFNKPVSMATDADGNAYVADNGNNSIRKVTPDGVVTTLAGGGAPGSANGAGAAAHFNSPQGIAVDAAGNIYVADAGNNKIRKITPQGLVSTFAGNGTKGYVNGNGGSAEFNGPYGIAIDAAGNLYVSDQGNLRIRKITPAGVVSTVAGNSANQNTTGVGEGAAVGVPGCMAIDKAGNIYFSDGLVIKKLSQALKVTTFAGSGNYGSYNGPGNVASFNSIFGIAADNLGNLYVTDGGNNMIRKITADGTVSTVAGGTNSGRGNGIGAYAGLQNPYGIAFNKTGYLYFSDYGSNHIRSLTLTGYIIDKALPPGLNFDPATGNISGTPVVESPATDYTVTAYNNGGSWSAKIKINVIADATPVTPKPAISYQTPQIYPPGKPITPLAPKNAGGQVSSNGTGLTTRFAGTGTTYGNALFSFPYGLSADKKGNIYLADAAYDQVFKITPDGTTTVYAGVSEGFDVRDGKADEAYFYHPFATTVDPSGNVFVADWGANLIRKITPNGQVSTFAGTRGGSQAVDGKGTAASFSGTFALAADGAGNIYVIDGNMIRKITPAGMVTTFAGSSEMGSANGVGTAARFNNPRGIATDKAGNVYITDGENQLIRKITPAGVVSTIAGSGDAGKNDGDAKTAAFNFPTGIAVDNDGNIFIADQGNSEIREITAAGVVTTIAGNGIYGNVEGVGKASEFGAPFGLTVDGNGNVYVSDISSQNIYKVQTRNYTINKALPPGLTFDTTTGIISGTPTASSPATDYIVTAYNAGGSSSTVVNIKIDQAPAPPVLPPKITYDSPKVYPPAKPIPPLTPHNTGGAVPQNAFGKATVFAGNGSKGNNDNTGTDASFNFPTDAATDSKGNVFVADRDNSLIRKITPAGQVITFAGNGVSQVADGQGVAASFKGPTGIAIDNNDNIYVTDSYGDAVRKITPTGLVTTIVGLNGPGEVDGAVAVAKIAGPWGIAVDNGGNIYISEWGSGNIREITAQGVVKTIAGSGSSGYADGKGAAASFKNPQKLAIDASGNIFVADAGNNKVRGITPDGTVSTLIGDNIYYRFQGITGVAVDVLGNLYISDSGNNRVIKIEAITGKESVLSDAAGTFAFPLGLTIDALGNLYVASPGNSTIVKIPTTGYTIDKPLPLGLIFDQTTGIISGTPTQVTPLSTYTITAYNEGGHSTSTVDIEIKNQAGPGLAPPNISYITPQVYTLNTTIPALPPTNTGGAVPPDIYGQVLTFAGNGHQGVIDGDKTTAGFSFPNYPVVAADGTVYITDNNRLIRQITLGGNVTTIAGSDIGYQDGYGTSAQFNAPAAMVIGADGSIYVVDSNNGKIRKVSGGGVSTFASGFKQPNGIAIDAAGNFYVSEYAGNTVKKITPDGTVSTLAGTTGVVGNTDGTGAAASFRGPSYMAVDIYGNIFLADYNNNEIRKITPAGVVTTFAGSGVKGKQDGQGTAASFNGPEGIAFGEDGSLYVSDAGNNLIRKITPDGTVTTFAGNGIAGYKDGYGINTSFNFPHGLAINNEGNMLVTDLQNNLVREIITTGYTIDKDLPPGLIFDAKTGTISGTPTSLWPATQYKITGINGAGSSTAILTIEVKKRVNAAGPLISYQSPQTYNINQTITPLAPTSTGSAVPPITFGQSLTFSGKGPPGAANGDAITASYHGPSGVAVDAAGNVYVADYLNNLIRKISPAGISSTLAGSGDNGLSNGTGAGAVFNKPASIAIDAAGNLYVADANNDVIRKITPGAVVTTFAGIGSAGSANGPGISASFNMPQGIAIDAAGNLYVADTFNNLIRKITPAGEVSTLAGSGAPGGNNGNGTNASFNAPQNLTVDAAGNVYVTDSGNNLIRKITPAGVVSTYAGSGSSGGNNGPALSASFNQPWGIVVDDIGDLFVSDFGGNITRMIDPAGNVSTLAGSGVAGSLNNTGPVVTFDGPKGLALDVNRKLYIADYLNNEIRTVYTLGYTIDKPLPSGMVFDGTTGTISGKPNILSPLTTYTITAYNVYGSATARVDIKVIDGQTITFPPIPDKTVCDVDFDPGATGSSPIIYTSSDSAVATIASGKVHIVGAGSTTITADDGTSKYPQTLTVTPALVPSVSISPVSADACALAAVTYTATPVNGGTSPHYQWKVNGQNSGTDNASFASTTLNNNDKITCELTSNLPCVTSATVTSNEATFVLDPPVTTGVTIVSSLTGPVCAGTEITFTANPALPALNPDFQWKINGENAGANNATFTIRTLADGDIVTCVITSDGKCLANPTAISNAITITFNPASQCVIVIPNTFTPNGDGINDLWNITALAYHPDCTVTVFSRYGSVVYRSLGYGTPWDGTTNGNSLPAGTYYYILDLKNGKKPMSGSVTILR